MYIRFLCPIEICTSQEQESIAVENEKGTWIDISWKSLVHDPTVYEHLLNIISHQEKYKFESHVLYYTIVRMTIIKRKDNK